MTTSAAASSESGGKKDADKAQRYFDRARDVADAEDFDDAIDLFLQGLALAPDDVPAHKELRLIALERVARGGADVADSEKTRLRDTLAKSRDPKRSMLIAEAMLAYDPDNPEWISCCGEHARRANFARAAEWFTRLAREA